jgi:phosphoribosylanthranilate isomerase
MTRVKICGIREKAHALAVIEAGGDFIGLVFAPSRRQVTPARAGEIVDAAKSRSDAIDTVGVFVNMPATEVNNIAGSCNLDWVQLSGDESWEYCRQISKPVIKAIRIRQGQSPEQILADLATWAKILTSKKYLYLLDSEVEGRYGGTGTAFDWTLARQAAEQSPVIIAGGLTPENVAEVIEMVAPWGVDVSSGVETGGVKDIAKIKAFIEAVRKADDSKR